MDYKVTDTELTTVADAIRAKAESEDALTWPNGFASKVASITGISSEDEGKVVQNGVLVAQTSRSVTENGTYDTTTNDELTIDVAASVGPLVGTDAPDPAVGENGDYYYRRANAGEAAYSINHKNASWSSALTIGVKIEPAYDLDVVGALVYNNTANYSVWVGIVDADTEQLVASVGNVSTPTIGWNKVYFGSKVTLQEGKSYYLVKSPEGGGASNDYNSINGYMRDHERYGPFIYHLSYKADARYANTGLAAAAGNQMYYGVIPLLYAGETPYVVTEQYVKSSGEWVRVA